MSIFEYLFERKNPGKVGSIEKNKPMKPPVNIPVLVLKLVTSFLLIYGLFYFTVLQNFSIQKMIIFVITLFLYCFISYWFIPRPDYSNVGLLGGLIDHPFRYTDDLNRFLIVISVILYPGRFIGTTMLQFIIAVKNHVRK